METISKFNNQNKMRTQVARSRGTEWMVSSYNAWQQRSPLGNVPKRNTSSILRIVYRLTPSESHLSNAISLSHKVMVLILGFLVSGKIR